MRFLLIHLPSLLYVDSSPLGFYPRGRSRTPCVSETRALFRNPITVSEHSVQISDRQFSYRSSTHLPLWVEGAYDCIAY